MEINFRSVTHSDSGMQTGHLYWLQPGTECDSISAIANTEGITAFKSNDTNFNWDSDVVDRASLQCNQKGEVCVVGSTPRLFLVPATKEHSDTHFLISDLIAATRAAKVKTLRLTQFGFMPNDLPRLAIIEVLKYLLSTSTTNGLDKIVIDFDARKETEFFELFKGVKSGQYALRLPNGNKVEFETAEFDHSLANNVDGLIIEGVWGFNMLGGFYGCIQDSLGIKADEVRKLCDENIFKNDKITLILLHSRNPDTRLKAIVLVPTQHCSAYAKLATAFYGKPYQDFYYNIIYEALRLLGEAGCKTIAVAALTGSEGDNTADPIIGKCAAEAIVHYALTNPSLSKIVSLGGAPDFLEGVDYFNSHPDKVGFHREIQRALRVMNDMTFCTIRITR